MCKTDIEAPKFNFCPPNIEKSTDGDGSFEPPSWPDPQATDNAGPPQMASPDLTEVDYILGQKIMMTYVATDASGNNATCQFYVLIIGTV